MHALCHHLVFINSTVPECVARATFTKFLLDSYIATCFCLLNHEQKDIVSAFLSSVMRGVTKTRNGKWNGMENIKFIALKGYRLDRKDVLCKSSACSYLRLKYDY